jgi:hypothetical protein
LSLKKASIVPITGYLRERQYGLNPTSIGAYKNLIKRNVLEINFNRREKKFAASFVITRSSARVFHESHFFYLLKRPKKVQCMIAYLFAERNIGDETTIQGK